VFAEIGTSLGKKEYFEGKKAKDKSDHIIYNEKNGKLFYDEDGKGGTGQKLIAKLEKGTDLDHTDFLIV
jgi:hypothetical protein